MKILHAIFIGLALLCCESNPSRYLDKRFESLLEVRAIRNLLKGFANSSLNDENIGIIIGYEDTKVIYIPIHRPAKYIAYFKYRHNDESIVVHYHLFPMREKYSDTGRIKDNDWAFKTLLEKFATAPSYLFFDGAKQLEMPLPNGLKNNSLLSKPHKKKKWSPMLGFGTMNYWGFKLKNTEVVMEFSMYPDELRLMMEDEILYPIELRLVYHETPAEWITESKKKLSEELYEDSIVRHDELLKKFGITK